MGVVHTLVEEAEAQTGPEAQPLALGHTETATASGHSACLLRAET